MTKRDWERLARIVIECEANLADPARQSMDIWRPDMRAIVAAHKEIQRFEALVAQRAADVIHGGRDAKEL